MTVLFPVYCQVAKCQHFIGPVGPKELPLFVCKAFPKGIPEHILSGQNNHTESVEGDGGVRYKREGRQ